MRTAPIRKKAGLSMAHKSTKCSRNSHRTGNFTYYPGGSMVQVSEKKIKSLKQKGGAKREKVKSFSKASRRRLMQTCAKIQRKNLPMFITLTYPGEFSTDPKVWKKDLKLFLKRLGYKYILAAGLWKLEPQKRGAPHYHIIVWGLSKLEIIQIRQYVALAWYEVVGSGDVRHLAAGTSVESIRSWNGVWHYVSKYLGKEIENQENWAEVGRYWGVFSRDNVPWAEVQVYEIGMSQVFRAIRYFRRYAGLRSNGYYTLTCFVNNDEDFWKRAILC